MYKYSVAKTETEKQKALDLIKRIYSAESYVSEDSDNSFTKFLLGSQTKIFTGTINPKHDAFYKSLGFTEIGTLKYYPAVNNAPALARILDIQSLQNKKNLPGLLADMLNQKPNYDLFK